MFFRSLRVVAARRYCPNGCINSFTASVLSNNFYNAPYSSNTKLQQEELQKASKMVEDLVEQQTSTVSKDKYHHYHNRKQQKMQQLQSTDTSFLSIIPHNTKNKYFNAASKIVCNMVKEGGYSTPFAVQSEVIPASLTGSDVIVRAQTGSGKTLCFAIQILHNLLCAQQASLLNKQTDFKQINGNNQLNEGEGFSLANAVLPLPSVELMDKEKICKPSVVVVGPTREIAKQCCHVILSLLSSPSSPLSPSICTEIYGGISFSKQERKLTNVQKASDSCKLPGPIISCNAGRLLDWMRRGAISLSYVNILILDEWDKLIQAPTLDSKVNIPTDILEILQATRNGGKNAVQTMLFSATTSEKQEAEMKRYLLTQSGSHPLRIDLLKHHKQLLPSNLSHYVIHSAPTQNVAAIKLIVDLLTLHHNNKTIIFTNKRMESDELAKELQQRRFETQCIHANLTQHEREKVMVSFREGKVNIVVATDVAARGIDIDDCDLVVHVGAPALSMSEVATHYLHRSGRTARAGKAGRVFLLLAEHEAKIQRSLEKKLGISFVEEATPNSSQVFNALLDKSLQRIHNGANNIEELSGAFKAAATKLVEQYGSTVALTAAIASVIDLLKPSRGTMPVYSDFERKKMNEAKRIIRNKGRRIKKSKRKST